MNSYTGTRLHLHLPVCPGIAFWILTVFFWWTAMLPLEADTDIIPKTDSTTITETGNIAFLDNPISGYWIFPDLHAGFNASVSMFTSIGIGGHHAGDTAFGQSLAFAWTDQLGKSKWSYAFAAQTSTVRWHMGQWAHTAVSGTLQYALNEHISLILSGYKQLFGPSRRLYGLYGNTWGIPDRYWEGAVRFKINDNCTIQVSATSGTMQGNP